MHLGMFQAEEFGDLQRLVDGLFTGRETIERLDLIVQAEILDLAPDLLEIVNLVPPGTHEAVRSNQLRPRRARLGRHLRHGRVGSRGTPPDLELEMGSKLRCMRVRARDADGRGRIRANADGHRRDAGTGKRKRSTNAIRRGANAREQMQALCACNVESEGLQSHFFRHYTRAVRLGAPPCAR